MNKPDFLDNPSMLSDKAALFITEMAKWDRWSSKSKTVSLTTGPEILIRNFADKFNIPDYLL